MRSVGSLATTTGSRSLSGRSLESRGLSAKRYLGISVAFLEFEVIYLQGEKMRLV